MGLINIKWLSEKLNPVREAVLSPFYRTESWGWHGASKEKKRD